MRTAISAITLFSTKIVHSWCSWYSLSYERVRQKWKWETTLTRKSTRERLHARPICKVVANGDADLLDFLCTDTNLEACFPSISSSVTSSFSRPEDGQREGKKKRQTLVWRRTVDSEMSTHWRLVMTRPVEAHFCKQMALSSLTNSDTV